MKSVGTPQRNVGLTRLIVAKTILQIAGIRHERQRAAVHERQRLDADVRVDVKQRQRHEVDVLVAAQDRRVPRLDLQGPSAYARRACRARALAVPVVPPLISSTAGSSGVSAAARHACPARVAAAASARS